MLKFSAGLAALTFAALAAQAGDLKIVGAESVVPPPKFAVLSLAGLGDGAKAKWEFIPVPPQVVENKDGTVHVAGEPGASYTATADVINFDAKTWDRARTTLVFGGTKPAPPPKPVDPDVKPDPDTEPASVNPFGDDKARVLILYETGSTTTLPASQQLIISGQKVRDYLDANCSVGADGVTAEYRMWDQNLAPAGAAEVWKRAMSREHPQIPWVVVGKGKKGYEGPLPKTQEEFITLCSKYLTK